MLAFAAAVAKPLAYAVAIPAAAFAYAVAVALIARHGTRAKQRRDV